MADASSDPWSEFVLGRQYGGDESHRRQLYARMNAIRDRVLDGARLREGMTFADVGAGQGLLGFGAIDRIGPSLRVVFIDISAPLLAHCEQLAHQRGVHSQCTFVQGSAEKLQTIADASIDVIATRASLMFVPDKIAALTEFRRLLKPGGRISLSEPISQDEAFDVLSLSRLIETQPSHPDIRFLKLLHRYRSAQFPSTPQEIRANPITQFSERDLVQLALGAGFSDVHLELHIDHEPQKEMTWEVFLDVSPNPGAPTLRELLATRFTEEDRRLLEQGLRPRIQARRSVTYTAVAYLTAETPPWTPGKPGPHRTSTDI